MAQKVLIIEESAKKAQLLKTYLNDSQYGKEIMQLLGIDSVMQLYTTFTKGHIAELDYTKNQKGFILDNELKTVTPIWAPNSDKGYKEIIKNLRDMIKMCDTVIISTDGDAAGEQIAYEIKEILCKKELVGKSVYRQTLNEITPLGLRNALLHKRTELDMQAVNEEQTRAMSDLEIGFTLSTMAREKIKEQINELKDQSKLETALKWYQENKKVLTHMGTGRLQAAIIQMVKDRENAIANYVEKNWFTINPIIHGLVFNQVATGLTKLNEMQKNSIIYTTFENAKTAISKMGKIALKHEISKLEHTISSRYAPMIDVDIPVSMFSNGVKTATQVAQTHYECGNVTYIRTDVRKMSPDWVVSALPVLQKMLDEMPNTKGQIYTQMPPKQYLVDKDDNNPHECIRITQINRTHANALRAYVKHKYGENIVGNDLIKFINDNEAAINKNYNFNFYKGELKSELLNLEDALKFYTIVETNTWKVLTNAPEYNKAHITVHMQDLPSEIFKTSLNEITVLGYKYLDTIYAGEKEDLSDESDEENVKIAEILNWFETNNEYIVENFDNLDFNNKNSLIVARKTSKPTLLTEKNILETLAKYEVGKPSTRRVTLMRLQANEKEVLKKKGHGLMLTEIGNLLAELTLTYAKQFTELSYTALFDKELTKVHDNEITNYICLVNLINELNNLGLSKYNWYTWTGNVEETTKGETVESQTTCPFCTQPMVENALSIYCQNIECPAKLALGKYGFSIYKPSIVKGAFCQYHPNMPMIKMKSGNLFCPFELTIFLANKENKLLEFKELLPKVERPKTNWTETEYLCPLCNAVMFQSEKTIACRNDKCVGYSNQYHTSFSIPLSVVNMPITLCMEHNLPLCLSKSGKLYCWYDLMKKKYE